VDEVTLELFAAGLERAAAGDVEAAIADALKACEVVAVAGYRRHFALQQAPDGTPWAALAHPRAGRAAGGEKALWDTGAMMAGATAAAHGTELVLGTNRAGAGLHQYGGTIVPRNVTYLTIPATAAARRAGGARRFPGELSPRVNRKTGKGVLLDADGEVQYYLTRGPIQVPARPHVGFSAETLAEIGEVIIDHVTLTLAAA
jgi:phage gpG-like protein